MAREASSAASSRPLCPSGPSGGGVGSGSETGRLSPPTSALALMLGLPLALGRSHLLELLLAHRLRHLLGRSLELALGGVAALGRKGGPGRLLLRFRFGRHVLTPLGGARGWNPRTNRAVPKQQSGARRMDEIEWWEFDSAKELAEQAAGDIGFVIESALEAHGDARVALPGEDGLAPVFSALAKSKGFDWSK